MKMMRFRFGLILIFVFSMGLGVLPSPSTAQDVESQWFYTFNIDESKIIAYTPDGQMNILVDDAPLYDVIPYAFFPDKGALVRVYYADGRQVFYFLTPTAAHVIHFNPDVMWWSPIAQTDRYLILSENVDHLTVMRSLLFDSHTLTFENMPTNAYRVGLNPYQFSEGGAYLRYTYQVVLYRGERQIIERHLASGTEQVLWGVEANSPNAEEATIRQHLNPDLFEGHYAGYTIETSRNCVTDCTITAHPPEGDSITVQAQQLEFDSLNIINDHSLLVSRADHYWLLRTESPPQYLGYATDPYRDVFHDILSPDQRWIVVYGHETNPQSVLVWDLQAGEVAVRYQRPDNNVVRLDFSDFYPNDVVFRASGQTIWFDTTTSTETLLPRNEEEYLHYYALLPDDTFLLHSVEAGTPTGTSDQFWHYDPVTDERTLLLSGNWRQLNFPDVLQRVYSSE